MHTHTIDTYYSNNKKHTAPPALKVVDFNTSGGFSHRWEYNTAGVLTPTQCKAPNCRVCKGV
jgi:hypothetical protein